jgi:ADP-ribose pyrophosphatase YjhB (NUDIX family)
MPGQRVIVKLLQRYWRISRGLTIGTRGAVVDADGRFLLVRHGYQPGWHFPGGGVERNEPVEAALRRELMEEAGIAYADTPELFGLYANFKAFPSDHVVLFVLRTWRQTKVPKPNAEIREQGFFPPDALPPGTSRATRARIDEILGRTVRGEMW